MLIMNPIYSDGKEYISAIQASKKVGYASDYVGQLCRAKKIPGLLIGKTWYVDLASLLEHKKNRQLGKVKKLVVQELSDIPQPSGNPVSTYEKDDRPRLPELSKKGRYVEPIWTSTFVDQAAALSLALLIAVSAGFSTLQYTAPSVATEMRQRIENTQDTGKKFLTALPSNVKHSVFNIFDNSQLALVSASDTTSIFFDRFLDAFQHLKELSLRKFFFAYAPTEITPAPPASQPKAVIEVNQSLAIDIIAIKDELKSELQTYLRGEISSAQQPLVIYQSTPIINTNVLREEILLADTRPTVTRQSDSDTGRNSINISNLTDGGTFINASLSGSVSGTGDFSILTFINATGTSATTTNLFSTNATFTNLTGTTLGLTDITFTNATGTSAPTPNFFTTLSTGNSLRIGGIATSTINSSGDLLVVGSTTLQNFTAQNSTTTSAASTNLAVSSITSSLLKTNAQGSLIAAVAGTDYENILTAGDGLTRTLNDIDCDTATSLVFGCLSSADWTTFNNKLAAMTFSWPFTKQADNSQGTTTVMSFLGGFYSSASSTLATFNFTNATGTSATTTGLAISGLSSELLKVNANGSVIEAVIGIDYQAE